MESLMGFMMAALEPLHAMVIYIMDRALMVIGALVLLLIGVLLARFMRDMVERLLHVIELDDHVRRIGVLDLLHRLGLGGSLIRLSGVCVHALIVLAFIVSASNAVGLVIVSEFLGRVVGFLPSLASVVVVLGGGLFLGHLIGQVVYRCASANHIRGAEALSRVIYGLMIIFSGLMGLRVLGIDTGILFDSMNIIVAAVGLGCAIAFGIAFGMAGRDLADRLIRDLTPKHSAGKAKKIRLRKAA